MPSPPPPVARPPIPKSFQFVLFCAAGAWFVASDAIAMRASRGIAERFDETNLQALLGGLFTPFLVDFGFRALNWIAVKDGSLETVAPFPRRPGFMREWGVGAAVGWGVAMLAVLPVAISGNLYVRLVFARSHLISLAVAIATLAVLSLVEEIVLRGYLFRRLIGVVGSGWATIVLSLIFGIALIQNASQCNALTALIVCTLFGVLLAMGYLRTHALWLPWGLHFAYRGAIAILFGLPVLGHGEFSSVVDSYAIGPIWLSGGDFGLDAALLTIPMLLIGMAVLYRVTRDYAWEYTAPVIVAAGYEVVVPPPAAHVAMERQTTSVAPPPLVQILPVTPRGQSSQDME